MDEEGDCVPQLVPVVDPDSEPFEKRIANYFRCTVCNKIPRPTLIVQCLNGHLQCEVCTLRAFAQANIWQTGVYCPICNVLMKWKDLHCNLAAKQVLSLLPKECDWCKETFETDAWQCHIEECPRKPTQCKYRVRGCNAVYPHNEIESHEMFCLRAGPLFQFKRDTQLRTYLVYNYLMDTAENYFDSPFELKSDSPYLVRRRSRGYFPFFYFTAFGLQWRLSFRFNKKLLEYHNEEHRNFKYSIVLLSVPEDVMLIHYGLRSTNLEKLQLEPRIYSKAFGSFKQASYYRKMGLKDAMEANRLLSSMEANLSLFMFLNAGQCNHES